LEPESQPEGPSGGGEGVIEHLRLHVPAHSQRAWIEAETHTWEPWLRQRQGFVGRELRWDQERQEGVLLIHWASRTDWKAIPEEMVNAIQADFESAAKRILGLPPESPNPFPLLFSGERSEG
jgi:uncharacterized protein (TIGR03792 family)